MNISQLASDDTQTHTNTAGGKQSHVAARFDLLPPEAVAQVAQVLHHGAEKYGADNWRLIPATDHINHALMHLFNYLATGDTKDLHHAACRVLFSIETTE